MIILVTGVPGSGKTCYVVDWLCDQPGRPIFADGIPDLVVEHSPCPPLPEWTELRDDPASASGKKVCFTYPPGSIVVIDEAQRVYRPRAVGSKVPPEVAAFETHRHEGLDFVLITQNPTLIDSNVRKLVGKHIHFRQTWAGRYRHEWTECADVESSSARQLAATSRYKLPARAFTKYKSAVLHTKNKAKIPFVVWLFLVAVIGGGGLMWRLYDRFKEINKPQLVASASGGAGVKGSGAPAGNAASPSHALTTAEYIESYTPRIEGLAHTAPAYDDVTRPVEAPIPAGCVDSKRTGCKCYDQQGNRYATTVAICKQILADGIFFAWRKTEGYRVAEKKTDDSVAAVKSASIDTDFGGSHVRDLAGGSHQHHGGLKPEPPKKDDPTYIIKPAG